MPLEDISTTVSNKEDGPAARPRQARWSLGKDDKGRRISFGFRDPNTQKPFTTPSRVAPPKSFYSDPNNDSIDIDSSDEENDKTTQPPMSSARKCRPRPHMTLQEAREADLYTLLGVSQKASPTEIKRAYHKLSFTYHPDKVVSGAAAMAHESRTVAGTDDEMVELASPEDTTAMFALIARAHEVLSDPLQRTTYDVYSGFEEKNSNAMNKINTLNSKEAENAIKLMQVEYTSKLEKERETNGIIITEARYGAVPSYIAKTASVKSQCRRATINVQVPVQCMVNDSKLYIHSGESKRWLPGFYDPLGEKSTKERNLVVRYQFRGAMHQVVVGDNSELRMPLKPHLYKAKKRKSSRTRTSRSKSKDEAAAGHRGRKSSSFSKLNKSTGGIDEGTVAVLSAEEQNRRSRRQGVLFGGFLVASISGLIQAFCYR
jgi:curved DNA-binding protein CbpA